MIEVIVARNEEVLPMVPNGHALNEMTFIRRKIMNNFNHYYDTETTRQVISVVVLNEHNVLSRIVGLFSARGYNIDSLTVAPITDSQYSRMTIVTTGDKRVIDQIVKQLNKLIPVLKVNEHKMLLEKIQF